MKIITTQKASCRDCHRCMRACLVKAIGIEHGQAHLLDHKCVLCGKCVVECPQHAKQVENNVSVIKEAIAAGKQVFLSLAPSFVASFPDTSPEELHKQLMELGFSGIEETAVGAEIVSHFYNDLLHSSDKPVISACCPVIVNTVKKYYPQLVDNLAPVVSPMQAHARLLKERFGQDIMVAFAGPCIAKMDEKNEPGSQVDVVITFEQLKHWLKNSEGVAALPKLAPAKTASIGARYYPVAGGILKSFTISEYTAPDILAVDGLNKCMEVFDGLIKGEIAPKFIEALACSGGCIDGPGIGTEKSSPAKRIKILEFASTGDLTDQPTPDNVDFQREHTADAVLEYLPSLQQIQKVLEKTGKFTKEDEKNCGACGFNSCREKAIAVIQGVTTIDTCVPYMRSKAESIGNIIVDNSLNGIIVVNRKMLIQEFNPTAEKMFDRQKERVKGRPLTEIMDCSSIMSAVEAGAKITNRRVKINVSGIITNQMLIPVPEHDILIIVMTDITDQEKSARELESMKNQTVEKATEIINKQMQVAQEIAGLLGETTAETKGALLELIGLLKTKGENDVSVTR